MYRLGALRALSRELLADQRGSVAVIFGLALPVLIGGMAAGGEAGYWYLTQTKLQQAADVSAHAAAIRLGRGDAGADLSAIAENIALNSGLPTDAGIVDVHAPPSSGKFAGQAKYVEVTLTEEVPRFLSSLFVSEPLTIRARAVAAVTGGSTACVLALSSTKADALYAKGSATISLTNCDVASNSSASSSINLQGGNGLNFSAGCAYAVGGSQKGQKVNLQLECGSIHEKSPSVADPYADLPEPTKPPGACSSGKFSGEAIPAGTIVNGVRIKCLSGLDLKGDVTIPGGVYYIDGDVKFTGNGSLKSTGTEGVTLYITGEIQLNGNFTLDLKAPTAAGHPYKGIVFFGARGNSTASHMINGNSGSVLQGAVYFPSAHLEFTGSSAANNGCTQVVANTITFSGNSGLKASCAAAGTRDIVVGAEVALVE